MILELLILINLIRVNPVKVDPILTNIAQQRAEYLCNHTFSHNGWTQYKSKFSYRGENLAKGFNNKSSLINQAFLNSPTHKAVMLNPHYKYVGIANKCNITVEEFGG